MKSLLLALLTTTLVTAQSAKPDPFEEGMRQAFAEYKKGNHEAVTAKLRELIKIEEERGAAKVGSVLPDAVEGWKGEAINTEDLALLGGGRAISRSYTSGNRVITLKVVKDSPLAKQLIPLLTNEDLLRAGNRKTHNIGGETAIMEGERKLQMVLDQRIYLEITGDETLVEKDLVAFARKLDLKALAKLK